MKVTVCQLDNDTEELRRDWLRLTNHVITEGSHLVLLPEMPFAPWFAATKPFDEAVWQAAVSAHEHWLERLSDLGPATVLGSRPVNRAGKRLNEAFVWQADSGYQTAHTKFYLPDEAGFWEASWYNQGNGQFRPVQSRQANIGFMICTDMWFSEHARAYGRAGVHLIAVPRQTPNESLDKWLAGGRTAAVRAGAYCLSSNGFRPPGNGPNLGGQGWVIDPDGAVLGLTSQEQPFLTVDIELNRAEAAKRTYPRYVKTMADN